MLANVRVKAAAVLVGVGTDVDDNINLFVAISLIMMKRCTFEYMPASSK
jgi:hypothetical protein